MAKRFEAKSIQEAWEIVNSIFPTDYDRDSQSSERAGYPIYRSSIEYYDYICDLGCRLEINLKDGNKTINVWVVKEAEEKLPELPTKEEIKETAANQYTFEPEQVQLVRVFVMGYKFENEANRAVYKAMRSNEDFWKSQIASDVVEAYCEDKGIEWGTIRVINITHYENEKDSGHYVIEAIVGARIKS